MFEFLQEGKLGVGGFFGGEEDYEDDGGDSAEREVDVETLGCECLIYRWDGYVDLHHRHVACWVKTPPRIGPTTLEIPNIEVMTPV